MLGRNGRTRADTGVCPYEIHYIGIVSGIRADTGVCPYDMRYDLCALLLRYALCSKKRRELSK